MNWRELKTFCNELSEEELDKKVVLWREDEAINEIYTEKLDEDYYAHEDEEFCIPDSELKHLIEASDQYPNGVNDFEKVYQKGHPILHEEF